jgi:hypothetical protein
MSPKMPPRPFYYEDKTLDDLLGEVEEIISSCREMARDFDTGKAVVKHSIAIRKQLAQCTHLFHSLRKEIVERREKWRAERRQG